MICDEERESSGSILPRSDTYFLIKKTEKGERGENTFLVEKIQICLFHKEKEREELDKRANGPE